eukprot:TRINITY_DN1733_c4_g2_i1.p1 TRINITY_DN1733_c4_g2~~TRINITY_DN1733_c4_g2_i1.p1  ORF type:complete len:2871 (+),score=1045.14 TRINITY_DN1733_c4_g2_i1:497-8614(+)
MLVATGVSYFFRLAPAQRRQLSDVVTRFVKSACSESVSCGAERAVHVPVDFTFATVVRRAVNHYCDPDHMKLPEAVFRHQGLTENLFVQLVCFENRLAVILRGPPGTSKTLSNNIIRDNMTGRGDFMGQFAQVSEVCRYQGSSQSTADEIKRKCEEASEGQKRHDTMRRNKRSLLFVDEAGLVGSGDRARKWSLKVLHYYLEAGLASVLMTNDPLDPAIGNRCVEVFLTKPNEDELSLICCGIIHPRGEAGLGGTERRIVQACCEAFRALLDGGTGERSPAELRWWFGLRDLFHLMRFIRRQQDDGSEVTITPKLLMRGLERNFNGLPELFTEVVNTFGATLDRRGLAGYSGPELRKSARRKLEVVNDSLSDNNRASEGAGRNLNDCWVRFKFLIDTTPDGSLLELLQGTGVEQFDSIQVLSLSALQAGDEAKEADQHFHEVTVVSQIAAAMESGRTVWLTNTRAIDGCLFDVFNQSYLCCTDGRNRALHFVPLAIGATLEYKRVHRNFQAIVHVTRNELHPSVLPSPFLNRLEKFTLTVDDVVEHATSRLQDRERRLAAFVRERCARFTRTLSAASPRCLYSNKVVDTLDSLVLDAIISGTVVETLPDERVLTDQQLTQFLYSKQARAMKLWKYRAAKLLQLMRPEGMLLAQKTLRDTPAYLRIYFSRLSPWSLRRQLAHLTEEAAKSDKAWTRTMIHTPNDVGLLLEVLRTVPAVKALAIDDHGAESLQEEIYRFCEEPTLRVLVVIVSPRYLGHPAVREVRHMLESPPADVDKSELGGRSVVLLQAFNPGAAGCMATPLFATGWDQVYIDAAGDLTDMSILRYACSEAGGLVTASEYPEVETVVSLAVVSDALLEVDSGLSARSVPPEWLRGDEIGQLYDTSQLFATRARIAHELLLRCHAVVTVVLELFHHFRPSHRQLVEMGARVMSRAGRDESHSAAVLLQQEEGLLQRHIVALALRTMLDDRGASALVRKSGGDLQQLDSFLAATLRLCARQFGSFEAVTALRVAELPSLHVGPSTPLLPGARALAALLPVSIAASDAEREANGLREMHKRGTAGELVSIIHREKLTDAFLSDLLRCELGLSNRVTEGQLLPWLTGFARRVHANTFQGTELTVWSARALCVVAKDEIVAFGLRLLPLASTGILSRAQLPKAGSDEERQVFAMPTDRLVALLFRQTLDALTDAQLPQWRAAVASHLAAGGRDETAWAPLRIAARTLIPRDGTGARKDIVQNFVEASVRLPAPHIDGRSLRAALEVRGPRATGTACIELGELYAGSGGAELPELILSLFQPKMPRAQRCRALLPLVPADVMAVDGPVTDGGILPDLLFRAASAPSLPSVYHPPGPLHERSAGMQALGYTALYDVVGGRCTDYGVVALARRVEERNRRMQSASPSLAAFHKVCLAAEEVAFIRAIAGSFASSPNPAFLSGDDAGTVTSTAQRLMCPQGFVARPGENPKVDEMYHERVMLLVHQLDRRMGTMSAMQLLSEQVPDGKKGKRRGALATTCGELVYQKCLNAERLKSRPGDLPFVYDPDDRLNRPFMKIRAALETVHSTWVRRNDAQLLVHEIESFLMQGIPLHEMRLAVFVAAAREWLGERRVHAGARKLSEGGALRKVLQLKPADERLLSVFLDSQRVGEWAEEPVGLSDEDGSLRRGFREGWTEMACYVMAMSAAVPECMFRTMCADIESIKGSFICGDKTRGKVTRGGDYKFDCVTQLDEKGDLASYARREPSEPLSRTGACLMLWGAEFAGMAIQHLLWPECHKVMWEWMFSGDLKQRRFGFQEDMSNWRLMNGLLTERTQTYFTHLGTSVGMSVDEAARLQALFTWKVVTDLREEAASATPAPAAAEQHQHQEDRPQQPVLQRSPWLTFRLETREEQETSERQIEKWWVGVAGGDHRPALAPCMKDLCGTSMELQDWNLRPIERDLPTAEEVSRVLRGVGQGAAPFYSELVNSGRRLELLPPLMRRLSRIAERLHTGLSGTTQIGEASKSVGEMLRRCYPDTPEGRAAADSEWKGLRDVWNDYLDPDRGVGPIGYQCGEQGEITFRLAGAANLSLLLTLPVDNCPLPTHQNIVTDALTSLVRLYNDVANRGSGLAGASVAPVDLTLLRRRDMCLQSLGELPERLRSHVHSAQGGTVQVFWKGLEEEVSFDMGALLPKVNFVVPSVFQFEESEQRQQGTLDILAAAAQDTLAAENRFDTPMPPEVAEELRVACHSHTAGAVTAMMQALNRLCVEQHGSVQMDDPLIEVLQKRQKTELPVAATATSGLLARHATDALRFFLSKLRNRDWETSELPVELAEPLPPAMRASLDAGLAALGMSVQEKLENIDGFLATCRSAEGRPTDDHLQETSFTSFCKVLRPKEQGIVESLAYLHLMDPDDDFEGIFVPVRVSQYVALRGYLLVAARELRNAISEEEAVRWQEDGADLPEKAFRVNCGGSGFGLQVSEECVVLSVEAGGPAQAAGLLPGMRILRVGDVFVETLGDWDVATGMCDQAIDIVVECIGDVTGAEEAEAVDRAVFEAEVGSVGGVARAVRSEGAAEWVRLRTAMRDVDESCGADVRERQAEVGPSEEELKKLQQQQHRTGELPETSFPRQNTAPSPALSSPTIPGSTSTFPRSLSGPAAFGPERPRVARRSKAAQLREDLSAMGQEVERLRKEKMEQERVAARRERQTQRELEEMRLQVKTAEDLLKRHLPHRDNK